MYSQLRYTDHEQLTIIASNTVFKLGNCKSITQSLTVCHLIAIPLLWDVATTLRCVYSFTTNTHIHDQTIENSNFHVFTLYINISYRCFCIFFQLTLFSIFICLIRWIQSIHWNYFKVFYYINITHWLIPQLMNT